MLVSRHRVRVPGLPSSLRGLRIAQVSDVHLPGNRIAARAALAHLQRERPEVVVLNGDMTESAGAAAQVREFAAAARGTVATVAVLGNWEYRVGIAGEAARSLYAGTGVRLLINETAVVRIGGSSLALVGLDDVLSGHPDIASARNGVVDTVEIWLVHEPTFADQIPSSIDARPAMLLAGHTHGGQIRVPLLPPLTPVGAGRFLEGWYRDTPAPLYVSRGVGTTAIPARFRCPAELPIFTLEPG